MESVSCRVSRISYTDYRLKLVSDEKIRSSFTFSSNHRNSLQIDKTNIVLVPVDIRFDLERCLPDIKFCSTKSIQCVERNMHNYQTAWKLSDSLILGSVSTKGAHWLAFQNQGSYAIAYWDESMINQGQEAGMKVYESTKIINRVSFRSFSDI